VSDEQPVVSSTLIQNVRLIDPLGPGDQIATVLISDGWIRSIEAADRSTANGTECIDAQGWFLGPGLVDLYSVSGEPGHESRETLASLLAAAAAGGITRLGILPTTVPSIDEPAQVAQLLQQRRAHQPYLMPWGAITRNTQGEQLTELYELAESGIVGFSDGQPLTNPMLLRRLLEYLKPMSMPIALWPCDRILTGQGVIREGADAIRLGLPGVSVTAETVPLVAILEQVADLLTSVHLMRISTRRSVELIRTAKAQGLPITASVSWLHLLYSTADLDIYDPNLRLEPPLGTPQDQAALIEGLVEGTLDAIALDHRAYTYEEKTVAFDQSPPGALGLELALPLLWQRFVTTQQWTPLQLWQYLSSQPARCLGQPAATLTVNRPAELILFNPVRSWTANPTTLKSLSRNTLWFNQELQGRVERIWVPPSAPPIPTRPSGLEARNGPLRGQ
jgi:dihydroorotase